MWARFLLYITGPVVVKVLATLGLGVVSYVGFDAGLTLIFNQIQTSFGTMPADISSLIFLSGVPTGMGMILSALFARIAFVQVSKIQRLA